MRQWFKENDKTDYPGEITIPVTNSLDDSVQQIIKQTKLGIDN